MTRLLFVDHTAQLGGAELCLADLARLFPYTAKVVLLSDGPLRHKLERSGIAVEVLQGSSGLDRVRKQAGIAAVAGAIPAVARDALTLARAMAPFDLVWANTHKAFVASAFAGLIARKPVVYHLHDMLDPSHFSHWNRRAVVTLANRCARAVVANSDATARAFIASGGRAERVFRLYNGFDFDGWCESAPPLRRQGQFVVGLFSRLSPWKGQHVLIEAMAHLDGRFHALLVGDALFNEQDYVESLHQQVARLGLAERVHFLGFQEDVAGLMRSCDAIVHCSVLPEAFGRVVVEGMAAAKPVIAVGSGGVGELIDHGRTGLLVPPGEPQALAAALVALAADPQWAGTLAQAAYQAATQRFSLTQIAQEMRRILAAIAHNYRGTHDVRMQH